MGIFDKVKNSSIASKTKEFQENQKEEQKEKHEMKLVKQQDEMRIKEGEEIIKSIMGTKMIRNTNFNIKLQSYVSSVKVMPTWSKINKQVKSELHDGTIEPQDISSRIDQLLIEYGNPKVMEKKERKAQEDAEKLRLQSELKSEKDRQKALQLGVENFDFKCSLHEKRMSTFGNQKEDIVEGYCILHEDKLVIKKFSVWKKSPMGDKIIPYSNINAIDFDKAHSFHVTSSIVISISGFEPIILKHTNEQDFQRLNEAWLNYNNSSVESQTVIQKSEISAADELLKYAELYKQGLLTEEEFEAKKKELL